MFYSLIGVLVLGIVAGNAVGFRYKQVIGKYVASACTGLLTLLLLANSFAVVPSGHVGVKVLWGSTSNDFLQEGLHVINPFAEVIPMSVRTHTYTMSHVANEGNTVGDDSVDALSKLGMVMHMDVSVPHRLIPSSAAWVYKNLGPDYDAEIIRSSIAVAVRQAASMFTEEEAYSSKRTELVDIMREKLDAQIDAILKKYKGAPEKIIIFPEVQLRRIKLPESVQLAINEKIATEQKIVQARNEAKRKQIEAEGIQKFQEIVSKGITPDLLKWKGIEATLDLATSKNAKVVVIGSSGELPLILDGK